MILPCIPETVEGSAPWLHVQDSQLEQLVFLCNLPEKYNQYEGSYGWAEVAAFMPQKESLIQVRLDSGGTPSVNSKFLYSLNCFYQARASKGSVLFCVDPHAAV